MAGLGYWRLRPGMFSGGDSRGFFADASTYAVFAYLRESTAPPSVLRDSFPSVTKAPELILAGLGLTVCLGPVVRVTVPTQGKLASHLDIEHG